LSLDPDALGIQSSTGLSLHPGKPGRNKNRRRKTLQRIGFSNGGLTHRRAPPPAFLFPSNNVKEPDRLKTSALGSVPPWFLRNRRGEEGGV